MCGRRRHHQPGMFGPPMAGNRGFGNDFTYGRGHHGRGCYTRRGPQHSLHGMAISAIATAIENKNEERNARGAALSREVSYQHQQQADPITPAAPRPGEYQPGDLDGLVRDLSLNNSTEKDKTANSSRAPVAPPPVLDDEAPPAYTPTATTTPPSARNAQPARSQQPTPKPTEAAVPTLKLSSPLLQPHTAHSLIIADLHALSSALAAYRTRRCGHKAAVTRARKALGRDLGVLEAERLAGFPGFGRREIKRAVREGRRGLRAEVRGLMRA